MATNGSSAAVKALWGAMGLLLLIMGAASGTIWAEVGKKVSQKEFSMLCGQIERIENKLDRMYDRMADLDKP